MTGISVGGDHEGRRRSVRPLRARRMHWRSSASMRAAPTPPSHADRLLRDLSPRSLPAPVLPGADRTGHDARRRRAGSGGDPRRAALLDAGHGPLRRAESDGHARGARSTRPSAITVHDLDYAPCSGKATGRRALGRRGGGKRDRRRRRASGGGPARRRSGRHRRRPSATRPRRRARGREARS